jgi:spoIIIJ-associated protein
MTGILGKLFGKKKKDVEGGPEGIINDLMGNIIELSGLELSYDIKPMNEGTIHVDVYGADEELLTGKEGQLLDAVQLYIRRAIQHQLPEENINVNIDCANFREQADAALVALAEKLKGIALSKGKSVYFRALPPKDRKVIHQYLAEDGRVKSRSIGDGHFKKIKIYPVKGSDGGPMDEPADATDEAFGNR